ncbi:unnamed protein product [Prorocentrum cordatum]|uniref:Uncharacterized protein n=1 Tax=Prorocentrum cordatum TaxID=2364126 RepID=A0ABN9PCN7_9DINO|nr:unnamed protein product [Polarella glacialis]
MMRMRSEGLWGMFKQELCVLLPATDANAKQVNRAQATVATWAKPYLFGRRRRGESAVAVLYSREPLAPAWEDATLSLPGDVDLRHPKLLLPRASRGRQTYPYPRPRGPRPWASTPRMRGVFSRMPRAERSRATAYLWDRAPESRPRGRRCSYVRHS